MSQYDLVAFIGSPNCGKTSLFNHLTGTRQKVANYAGVTVERKEGVVKLPSSQTVRLLDLPGTYSLNAASPDEEVTRAACMGELDHDDTPTALINVVDASNLRLHLNLVLEVCQLAKPMMLVLNMMDEAKRLGVQIDLHKLEQLLGLTVVESIAVKKEGTAKLLDAIDNQQYQVATLDASLHGLERSQQIDLIMAQAVTAPDNQTDPRTEWLDRILLHPVLGLLTLAVLMFVIFQAVFSWSAPFMDGIERCFEFIGQQIGALLPDGLLQSLMVDGIIAGVGGVLVFLPQIIILFFFILILEESGYLPRAAFLLDKLMFKAGLSGRSFIPLLSSFACAIPGVMATRTINDPRDRLTTIMVAPLMTCSARLPVYALLIGAFIPQATVAGFFNLQGLVLFVLYFSGIIAALIVSFVMKKLRRDKSAHALLLELPVYRIPDARSILLGLQQRAMIFLKRVGGIIFALTVLLWVLVTFPQPPVGATAPAIDYSLAGQLGHLMQPIFAPLGFTWEICIALIPAMAAREVIVASLGTIYAVSATSDDAVQASLSQLISSGDHAWSIATGLSLLVWFIFAPHCLATLATVKRETGTWRYVIYMCVYLFGLAYLCSFITYHLASKFFG